MLTSQRLQLRALLPSDLANVHELLTLPETDEHNTLGIPQTIQVTEKIIGDWINSSRREHEKSIVFVVESLENTQFIGLIALKIGLPKFKSAEVWFKTHKNHWRQGYTHEALVRILHYGFNDLYLHRIEAGCSIENTGSTKTLEKAGFIKEGHKRKRLPIRGEWKDSFFYAILNDDFSK